MVKGGFDSVPQQDPESLEGEADAVDDHEGSPLSANQDAGGADSNGADFSAGQQIESHCVPVDTLNGKKPVIVATQQHNQVYVMDDETICGLGRYFSPSWLQRLASKQMFLAVFCLTCVLQGMFFTYFVSVLTTIEKLFQIQSKTTGIIMSATEVGQIGGSLVLTYYGGLGHRPKWIGWGMVLFAASSFLCCVPHLLFWRVKPNTALSTPAVELFANSTRELEMVCRQMGAFSADNFTLAQLGSLDQDNLNEQCASSSEQQLINRTTTIVLAIFFMSLLGIGIGRTAVDTLGIPYIDDNIANRESPTYFAITIGVKILGPVFGFMLGSFCTSLYVDPFMEADVTPKDPQWIGAWWLGMIFVSVTIFLASFPMFAFPRRLAKKRQSVAPNDKLKAASQSEHVVQQATKHKNPSLKDFPKAVKRLLKNDILVFRTASSVLHILPIAGLYTFLPKYLESQFRLTAHHANMISGIGGILVVGFGIFFSGVFIRIMKPSPKFVAAWIALTALLYAIGMALLMLMGCPMDDFVGLNTTETGKGISLPCERSCECNTKTFAPICTSKGDTYYSACHAGCTSFSNLTSMGSNISTPQYSNCQCLDSDVTATTGYCELECNNFVWYIGIFSLFVFIHSTSEVGSMLLTLRCVHARDKTMAMGLIQFAIGLFANVPCPIIYGAVVDSACLVWEETCGKHGACWLYDSTNFRLSFHGLTAALMLLAFFVDLVVWFKADKITFDEDESLPPVEMEEMQPFQLAVQYESTL